MKTDTINQKTQWKPELEFLKWNWEDLLILHWTQQTQTTIEAWNSKKENSIKFTQKTIKNTPASVAKPLLTSTFDTKKGVCLTTQDPPNSQTSASCCTINMAPPDSRTQETSMRPLVHTTGQQLWTDVGLSTTRRKKGPQHKQIVLRSATVENPFKNNSRDIHGNHDDHSPQFP